MGPALNLGIDDAGPLIELAVLREIAAPLEPRVVFWLFFEGNDLKDLDNEWGREPLRRYLESEYRTGVFERQPEVDRRLRTIVSRGVAARTGAVSGASVPGPAASFVTLTRLRAWLQRVSAAPRARAYPFEADRFRSVIEAARDETRSWGGELVFVYLPAWERFAEGASANPHRGAILELVDDLDVPVVDAGEIFAARPDPLALFPYRLRGHYTGAGYRLIATEMEDSYLFPDE